MGKFRRSITPKFIQKYADIYREQGFKGVIKKGGIWILAAFILFYLVRDSILYILIPYLIAKGIFSW